MDTSSDPGHGEPPSLDEDERDRVLDAATELFRNNGPRALTLKWVALVSGVPAERLAVEWPKVDRLLAAVLDRLSDQVEGFAGEQLSAEQRQRESAAIDAYEHIVARALLDGINAASLVGGFEQIERWTALLREQTGFDERSVRIRLSQTFALEWGWRLFGPHIRVACGLPDLSDEEFMAELRRLERHILALPVTDPD